MKKKLFALLLIITSITVMLLLISCSDNDINSTDDSADKHASSEISKAENTVNNEQTAIQTEPSTETQTDINMGDVSNTASDENGETSSDPAANNTISLNTDLLNEYMMTYAELTEKHGKVVGYERFDGGNFYLLEKGYAYYFFYLDYDQNKLVKDPDSGLKYMPVDDDELCRGIRNISPELLFNGTFETLSIEAIANMDGINYVSTNSDGIVTPRACASHFTYDGWNSDKVELFIYHEDEAMIDLTSEARIYIHPQDIRAEEEQHQNNTISLNMELIADYGLTFDELLAKYGKVTHFASPKGGTCYKFERGYGFYCCGDVSRIVDWVYDDSVHCENGGSRKNCYAVIDGDTTCYSIDQITASDLFSESFTSLTIEEISKIPGISYIKTSESDFEQGVYSSIFKYDGFSHKNGTEIFIEHYDKNEITPTSEVEIFTRTPYN